MFVNTPTTNQSSGNCNIEVMDPQSHQQLQQQEKGTVMPGFRFHPTDEELVGYYLRRQVMHSSPAVNVITQLDIYKLDPWDLPKMSTLKGEKEWYFFCPRDRKYRNSTRPNRVTGAGFWKATGTDRPIYSNDAKKCIGLKKSLVFYTGRAAKSTKTDWMMHEFRMPASTEASTLGRVQSDKITLQQIDVQEVQTSPCLPKRGQGQPRNLCHLQVEEKPTQFHLAKQKDQRTNRSSIVTAEIFLPLVKETSSSPSTLEHLQDTWAVCRIFRKSTLAQRHAPPCQQWEVTEPQKMLIGASAPSFVLPGSECVSSPDLEHDTSSQERSDTTSEDLDVEGSIQRTMQDTLPHYLPPRGYTTVTTHVQQPQQQEQTTATWPATIASSMEELFRDTSSARSNLLQQRSHISSEMFPLEMQNLFGQDQPSMRGALDYVSCIINPPQTGTQFVGSNFDNNMQSGESMNMIHSLDTTFSWVEPRMSTPLDIFRKELTQQIPHQRQVLQPWD